MSEINEQIVERLRDIAIRETKEWNENWRLKGEPEHSVEKHPCWQAAARIKVLEEALRPFAISPDDWTVGTVNAARSALNATPQDGKGGEEWD